MDFEPISRHLDVDPSVEVTALTFEEAFNNLSGFIAEASEKRKASLRALLPTEEETKASPDPVELATAVFQCNEISRHDTSPYFLFGWEDISSHHCLPEKEERTIENVEPKRDPPQIVFSPHGAKVVQKLVELTGLDYVTATMADMDQMHSTYFCDCCVPFPNADGNPGQCRFGYNWRAMVRFHGLNIAKKSKIDNKFCVGNSSSSQRRRPQPEFQDYDSFRSRSSRDEEKREKQRKMASRSVDMCALP